MISVYIGTAALLTLAWCVLSESFSLVTVSVGLIVGTGCVLLARAYLPLSNVRGVSFLWLLTYPLYMLAQIYIAAFSGVKMVLTDAKAGIVEVEPKLTNGFLKILLAHSATLTPGTVTLDMESSHDGSSEDKITFLCLIGRSSTPKKAEQTIRNIEKRLLRAQKRKD